MGIKEKIICLVDGEHYLPVTKSAIDMLNESENSEVLAIVFIGGTEKLRINNPEEYSELMGLPVYFGKDKNEIPYDLIIDTIHKYEANEVIDLSDEPILDYSKRFKIASKIMTEGVSYSGSDFKFKEFKLDKILKKPSLKIIGTGKRIGKTAVSTFVSRIINQNNYNPCVLAMGRGGPEEPEIVRGDLIEITPEYLMKQSNKGVHAASDHWEDALMSRVLTIGCRRCGGGMLGEVFLTNMPKGAELANDLDSEFVIVEGSGAAIPPVETDKNILLIGAGQELENIGEYFGPFRLRIADLIIITMCEEPIANEEKVKAIEDIIKRERPDLKPIKTVFRPKPLEDISGKKVLFATTAPENIKDVLADYLEKEYDCEVVGTTSHLSDRTLLKEDLNKYMDEADIVLSELKAAAVDVVTKDSLEAGLKVVYSDNIPIAIDDESGEMEKELIDLVDSSIEHFNK